LLAGTLPLEWVNARVVADSPAKVLNPPERRHLHMLPKLEAALGKPTTELDLVSPYFVPTQEGTAALVSLVQRGVKVRVLTNSLAATDVSPVHAGYSKYRERLLQGGVMLYELKPAAGSERKKERGESGRQRMGSSSGASLHAKTFAVDRSRIYVGSFNLDPRSARLNTEMGVVLDSANLATSLSQEIDEAIPDDTYAVQLQSDGQGVEWIERTNGGEVRHTTEPGAGFLKRLWIGFLSILPIEWLL
jgi:putative cardiolipin synthase